MDERQVQLAECRLFTRYLIDIDPDPYVISRYTDALERARSALAPSTGFDRLLLSLSRTHPLLTRAVDVYARFFVPASALRRRLVLLLAIIESSAPTAARLEQPDHAGLAGFILGMTWRSAMLALLLLSAILLLLPVQLFSGRWFKGQGES